MHNAQLCEISRCRLSAKRNSPEHPLSFYREKSPFRRVDLNDRSDLPERIGPTSVALHPLVAPLDLVDPLFDLLLAPNDHAPLGISRVNMPLTPPLKGGRQLPQNLVQTHCHKTDPFLRKKGDCKSRRGETQALTQFFSICSSSTGWLLSRFLFPKRAVYPYWSRA